MSNEQKKIWVEFNRNCEKNKIPKPSQNHFEILLKHSGCDVKKQKRNGSTKQKYSIVHFRIFKNQKAEDLEGNALLNHTVFGHL